MDWLWIALIVLAILFVIFIFFLYPALIISGRISEQEENAEWKLLVKNLAENKPEMPKEEK